MFGWFFGGVAIGTAYGAAVPGRPRGWFAKWRRTSAADCARQAEDRLLELKGKSEMTDNMIARIEAKRGGPQTPRPQQGIRFSIDTEGNPTVTENGVTRPDVRG